MGKLMDKMGIRANRLYLKAQKHSPEILMVAGGVAFVGALVAAGKGTLEAQKVLAKKKEDLDTIHEAEEASEEYSEELKQKDLVNTYAGTAAGLLKAYAPTVALGSLSLACILTSNKILKKRYLVAVSAYNAVSGAFEAYRSRVREEEGVDADRHYMFGTERQTVSETVVNEKGKKVDQETTIELVPEPGEVYEYCRYFMEGNKNWDRDPGLSLMFLRAQEARFNNLLDTRGHVFLNEVLDELGFGMTQIGAVAGWVKGNGDDYIDFGLHNYQNPALRKAINGDENVIPIVFNCDGLILDKI